ncbi:MULTISPECIES: major capsid protein [unclassified Ensifer]|uniref:major capsid protein n=1 Tax=unclassified Ensifer TaxID=2633371 RepID=UPI0008130E8B|nr:MULTISPECIES: phage capsid protein [unclassified Ensifer]OCP21907.1 phage capsid protein [Ensifer sp. LC54]OCP23313.1 phage capsid protein [Ensifer sp. LC384]
MPLLITEAEKLSQEDKARGVIEEIIDTESLFALMPFQHVNDKTFTYVREGTLSEGEFLDAYEAVPEGAATFDEVTAKLKVLAGDVDIDKFTAAVQSHLNPQIAIQLAAKAKGLGRKFKRTIVNGDSAVNPKSFDGIKKLTPAAQTLVAGTNGAAVSAEMLDELLDAVKLGADVLMMRRGTWRAIRAIMRSFGGNTGDMIQIANFGKPVPAYDGIPVIINDFITADEVQGSANETTSIYALRLNEADGFHGIFGGPSAGIQFEDIGTIQNKDASRYRVKWYAATALKATHSVARLKGILNI